MSHTRQQGRKCKVNLDLFLLVFFVQVNSMKSERDGKWGHMCSQRGIMVVLTRSKQREVSGMIREKGRIDGTTHRSEGWKPTRVEGHTGLSWDDGTLRVLWNLRHWRSRMLALLRVNVPSKLAIAVAPQFLAGVSQVHEDWNGLYKKAVWLNRIQTNQKAISYREIACLGEQLRTAQKRARGAQAGRITAGPSPRGGGRHVSKE